jgi:hypothetical protein
MCGAPFAPLARTEKILNVGGSPAWQSLGESNPSFQVENLTS